MAKYKILEGFVIGVEAVEVDGKTVAKRKVAVKGKTEELSDKQVASMNLLKRRKVELASLTKKEKAEADKETA